jgi:antitoxin component of RelBE/YafQ-DinJ toxin-antitoxin module
VVVAEIPFDVINSEERRNEAILKAIKDILGSPFQSANRVF